MSNKRPPLLELRGAGRRWGERSALSDLSLSIPPGQSVALVGPSGSGKTTLLRLLAGALAASEGGVTVAGQDMRSLRHHELQRYRAGCGIVPQSQALIRQLSVHHNVAAGLLAQRPWYRVAASLLVRTDALRVRVALEHVGLRDRQWDDVSTLSFGQQQRVAVARALVRDPLVLLADEPTASLDPVTARAVADLLAAQARQRGATLVVSTHQPDQMIERVDRVIGLRDGRIALDSATRDLASGDLDAFYDGAGGRQ